MSKQTLVKIISTFIVYHTVFITTVPSMFHYEPGQTNSVLSTQNTTILSKFSEKDFPALSSPDKENIQPTSEKKHKHKKKKNKKSDTEAVSGSSSSDTTHNTNNQEKITNTEAVSDSSSSDTTHDTKHENLSLDTSAHSNTPPEASAISSSSSSAFPSKEKSFMFSEALKHTSTTSTSSTYEKSKLSICFSNDEEDILRSEPTLRKLNYQPSHSHHGISACEVLPSLLQEDNFTELGLPPEKLLKLSISDYYNILKQRTFGHLGLSNEQLKEMSICDIYNVLEQQNQGAAASYNKLPLIPSNYMEYISETEGFVICKFFYHR